MKRFLIILFIFVGVRQISNGQVCVGQSGQISWEIWQEQFNYHFSELYATEYFPTTPHLKKTLYSTASPINYDNYHGARMRGFIHVPEPDSVQFNVTGDDKVKFFLSTDSTAANLVEVAYTNSWTSREDHTKYPEQTSDSIFLDTAQYYYFELIYLERTGGDHGAIWWKSSFLPNTEWNTITADYLNDVGCLPASCPERGLPCDDGDAMTENDVEDGFCHCQGSPITANTCIGERGSITSYRYDNIPGSSLNDLYNDPNYPAMPATSSELMMFGTPESSAFQNNGYLLQGYITVPVTGNYKFNVTGNNSTVFNMSNDEDPLNKTDNEVIVNGYTGMTEHDKYGTQSSGDIFMETGKYYYVELNSKQSGGSFHYQVFWQAPYHEANTWKRIPSFYLYNYECEIACVPQNTLCDDGDPFTNNDRYNGSCECVGTPCSGPDCDSPLANYVPFQKCNKTDQLDNNASNNWLSCSAEDNPNPANNRSHWIMYDLGNRYKLIGSHIWNYNVENETNKGFENVQIDYSEDGSNWSNLGTYNWPLSTGDPNYGGFIGPSFADTYAQYVLITSLDDTLTCRGLGKVTFSAVVCPVEGTSCDDGLSYTVNDTFNNNCECIGEHLYENECDNQTLVFGDVNMDSEVHSAIETVTAISNINDGEYVGFIAGDFIELNPGFETLGESNFSAFIDTCAQGSVQLPANDDETIGRSSTPEQKKKELTEDLLNLVKVPNTDQFVIEYRLNKGKHAKLEILDQNNRIIATLVNKDFRNKGIYTKRIRTKRLIQSWYTVRLITSENTLTKKLAVE